MMATIEMPVGCSAWHIGDPTRNPPADKLFLETLAQAGYLTFTHEGGLCGAKSGSRSVMIINRRKGRRWEVVFQENKVNAIVTMTNDLPTMTTTVLMWLKGGWLVADDDSLHGVVRQDS